MGSTGHGKYSLHKSGDVVAENFGVEAFRPYRGAVPPNSGLEQPAANRVTYKVETEKGENVLFQFRLDKSGKTMTIVGYRDSIPAVKCKVDVDSGSPSLDKVIATGSAQDKTNATRMKNLFSQSTTVKEGNLAAIANKLIQQRQKRQGSK